MTTDNKAPETKPVTEQDLKAQLNQAMQTGDWKQIAKVAAEIAKLEKAKEDAEREKKLKALVAVEDEVKALIQKALQPLIDAKKLDMADGVWYTQDFGEKLVTCKLIKGSIKKSTGGGGGVGKKFDVSTTDLLAKFGNDEYKNGKTYQAAWDEDADKNKRFAIRESLLKKGGYK